MRENIINKIKDKYKRYQFLYALKPLAMDKHS